MVEASLADLSAFYQAHPADAKALFNVGETKPDPRCDVPSLAAWTMLAIPLLFAVSVLSFLLLSLAPGNAALEILGNAATPARVAAVERQLGLNLPLWTQ